jgi:hypothetical protein
LYTVLSPDKAACCADHPGGRRSPSSLPWFEPKIASC